MNRLVVSALCLLLLAACETTGAARPPPVGASVQDIEPGRVRVTFRGVSRASQAEVADRALLQAAEVALMRGYDWFRVTDRAADLAPPTRPRITIGVGTGSYGRSSAFGVGGSTGFGGEGTHVVSLEALFGRNPRPPGVDVYDARSVEQTLKPRLP